MCNAMLPCRICYVVPNRAETWNSLQRMTNASNRPILHWPLTHYYTACMFHVNFMHYTESDHQKLGTNTLLVPPTKKLGGLVSPGPHGCCAYAAHRNLEFTNPWSSTLMMMMMMMTLITQVTQSFRLISSSAVAVVFSGLSYSWKSKL